jgi:putative membrane protein
MATAVTASAQVAISQDGRPEKMAAIKHNKGLNNTDMKMFQAIYWGNAFEIKASEIAVNRGQSAWAKQYAKEMVHEHTMAQNELKLLAQDKGVSLNNNMPRELVNALNRLRNASSSSFDSQYRAAIMSSHAQASTTLQKAIKFGHDEEVRSYAIKMLPAVKDHYAMAQIRKTMMGATKSHDGV